MLKLIKGSILNTIQVAAEVNAALKENTLVVVTKDHMGSHIYAGHGTLEIKYTPDSKQIVRII